MMRSAFWRWVWGGRPPFYPRLLQPLVHLVPVDGVEPRRDVVRPSVLVVEVVSVLPHVDAEDRSVAVHVGAVLVRVALDRELAGGVSDEPAPPAAELADRGLGQLLLEGGVSAEGAGDRVPDAAGRLAAATWTHDRPEDRVVRVAARVVAQDVPDVLGHRADAAQQVLD